ncbi:DUF1330 domain-containing protein [Kluyvera sp. STS39-E]|uniref:DUF1330 domain-containing protein n=1 Tax=Enterobacteriaceae TaxID=543 RepID=UPI000E3D2AD5|nr:MULTISPECIES: DUF1330 domain-containing protein [Citrobacter]MBD0826611.1 DUF1330 domain-containing protein [Citrobacter sp. C1]RFU93333.1 DUF1330 domain-containing protein [Citrobacter gillenii]
MFKKNLLLTLTVCALIFASAAQSAEVTPHAYVIANYDIKDHTIYQKYMDVAGPLVQKYDGKVTVFNESVKAKEGRPHSLFAIAEFPSIEDAERFYNSPEYTEAKKFRIASTEGWVIITK